MNAQPVRVQVCLQASPMRCRTALHIRTVLEGEAEFISLSRDTFNGRDKHNALSRPTARQPPATSRPQAVARRSRPAAGTEAHGDETGATCRARPLSSEHDYCRSQLEEHTHMYKLEEKSKKTRVFFKFFLRTRSVFLLR